MITRWLSHPATRNLHVDDPETMALRKSIVKSKTFLRRIYEEWYRRIAQSVPAGPGRIVELGSGPGFLQDVVPEVMTLDIQRGEGIDVAADAHCLPFADGSLKCLVAVNVLHHLCRPRAFFSEAERCVREGGAMVLIEPWISRWSTFVYGRLHPEPCDAGRVEWETPPGGPLSAGNVALPWIVFDRDRRTFEELFPCWSVAAITLDMPFVYMLSGGVSLRSLMPGFSYPLWRGLERALSPWMKHLAMFAFIQLSRDGEAPKAAHSQP